MQAIRQKLSQIQWKQAAASKRGFIGFVLLFYVFFSFFYMGPTIWDCNNSLSGIGDNTGGPIWRAGIEPQQPLLGGYEKVTNYPYGESLYSPVGYASVAQTALIRGASEVVGPVCAYNVVNMIGFLSTALIMCAFVLYLVKSRWIAVLAGYAVAFTPYVQTKVGGHPSYGYAGLLIGILWLTLHIIKQGRYRHGVGLAAVLAVCAYFDPYFILLAGTVLAPTLCVWALLVLRSYLKNRSSLSRTLQRLKVFAVGGVVFTALVGPLVFVRIRDANTITATTSSLRGNVEAAAMLCSNLPLDYLLPDPWNTTLMKVFGSGYSARNISHRNWCGTGESRVSLSLIMISTVGVGALIIFWERLNGRRLKKFKDQLGYPAGLVIGVVGLVALTAFLLGLPPRVNGILTPSGLVIKITETWRIFAREYLVLNIMLVSLFALMLSYFKAVFWKPDSSKRTKAILAAILVALGWLILAEYQVYSPFKPATFSYERDVPQIYRQIKDNRDITALAEYPLDRIGVESDVIVYYTTMQVVHKKPLLNSAIGVNSREKTHISIKDLSDPQTIPALRGLGFKYLTIHGLSKQEVLAKTDQLEIISQEKPEVYGLTLVRAGRSNNILLAKIKPGPKLDHTLTIKKGYVINIPIMKSPVEMEYETIQDTELELVSLKSSKQPGLKAVCFSAKMANPSDQAELQVKVNGVVQQTLPIGGSYSQISLQAKEGDIITLHNSKGYNTRLNNLGCSP